MRPPPASPSVLRKEVSVANHITSFFPRYIIMNSSTGKAAADHQNGHSRPKHPDESCFARGRTPRSARAPFQPSQSTRIETGCRYRAKRDESNPTYKRTRNSQRPRSHAPVAALLPHSCAGHKVSRSAEQFVSKRGQRPARKEDSFTKTRCSDDAPNTMREDWLLRYIHFQ